MIIADFPVYNSNSNYYIDNLTNSPTDGVLSEHFPITLCGHRPDTCRRNEFNDGYHSTMYRTPSACSDSNQCPPDVADPDAAPSQLPEFKSAPSLHTERQQRLESASVSEDNPSCSRSTMDVPNSPVSGLSSELRQVSGLPFTPDSEVPLALTLPVGFRRASEENLPLPIRLKDNIEVPTSPREEYADHNEFTFAFEENVVTSPLTPTTPGEEYMEYKEFPFPLSTDTSCSSNYKIDEQPVSEIDETSSRSSVGSSIMAASIFGSVQSRKGSIATRRSSRATTLGSVDGTLTKSIANPRASVQPTPPRLASLPSQSYFELSNEASTATAPKVQADAHSHKLHISESPHLHPSPRQGSQLKLESQPKQIQRPTLLHSSSFRITRSLTRCEDRKYAKNQAKHRRACNRELNKLAVDKHREKQRQLKEQADRMIKESKKELKNMEKERRAYRRDLGDVVNGLFGFKLVR